MFEPTLLDHVLAALVGFALPAAALLRGHPGLDPEEFDTPTRIGTYWGNALVLALLAGATAALNWRAGRSPGALGLGAGHPGHLVGGLVLGGVVLAAWAVDTARQLAPERLAETRARWRRDTPFMPVTRREQVHFGALAVVAGFSEELVFRGFLVVYLTAWTGTGPLGLVLAVLLPSLVFGAVHRYQGWHAVAKIVVGGAAFGALLLWTGSLWIPIALHAAIDLAAGVLSPRLLGDAAADAARDRTHER